LQLVAKKITGLKLNGLAGLYCYFLLISHDWLADGSLAGWLIPSEFMDVNYGQQVKQYLLRQVTLLRIHRFNPDDVQFGDALVSSAVVWFRKEKPPANHKVEFSYGGTLAQPDAFGSIPVKRLQQVPKWTGLPAGLDDISSNLGTVDNQLKLRLSDLFNIRRGLVTGANKFFILTSQQILHYKLPLEFLIPILPSPRYVQENEIEADTAGNPCLDRQLFLLACNLPENEVKTRYPSLWEYLQIGVRQGIHERYLCRHRSPWYTQENRPASPLLCTYMGRKSSGSPFRFILNHSKATAPNVYLMLYPKPVLTRATENEPNLLKAVWQGLNEISAELLIGEGRVYGGGLHKIEPNELANAPADTILAILPELSGQMVTQLSLFD
jgi:hypothetical protein